MAEITVRRACSADALLLAAIEEECFTDPWKTSSFETLLANPASHFIIAEYDGVPVAYGAALAVVDECEILKVAVAETMRRKGIGHRIVECIIGICRELEVSFIYLEHRESNSAAAALYESFGFAKYNTRRKYYSSPVEDAVLRKLTL